jgi:integrase/recombinase XerD
MATVYRRGGVWWIRYKRKGREVRRSAKTTNKATALAYLNQLVEEEGRYARSGLIRKQIRELLDRFEAEHLPSLKPRSAERYRTSIKMLKPHLAGPSGLHQRPP